MKKILIALVALTISLSSFASERYHYTYLEADDVIGYKSKKDDPSITTPLTFSELEAIVEADDPNTYKWCIAKASLLAAALNDREGMSRDEALDMLKLTQSKLPTYKSIELTRIISDVYRMNAKGTWRVHSTESNLEKYTTREYQLCVVNGF